MTPQSISRRLNCPVEIVLRGIAALEKPDPTSRTPDHEGRRIVKLDEHRDWGWFIVNYQYYRNLASEEQRREKTRLRTQKWRGKRKETPSDAPVTHVDASDAMQREREMEEGTYEQVPEPVLTPPVDPNWGARIESIHTWYSEQRGGDIRLDEFNKRLWWEWFRLGYEEDDFKRVFHMKRSLTANGDHPAGEHLRNLLDPAKFPDLLADAKSGIKPKPRSARIVPEFPQNAI